MTSNTTFSLYRAKPIEVSAIEFTGHNRADVFAFLFRDDHDSAKMWADSPFSPRALDPNIRSEDCYRCVDVGDWVVRKDDGKSYVYTPSEFAELFEPIGESK